jgi:hypothetical protein
MTLLRPSIAIVRPLALRLPEVAEASHLGAPDFRVRGKIFVTAQVDGPRAVLKLPRPIQDVLVETQPWAFATVPGWGQFGWTFAETDKIDADMLRDLLDLAWRQVAPKKLAAAHAASFETPYD